MVPTEIYIDNNATTRPLREVVEVVSRFMDREYGNPSSAHGRGGRCNEFLNKARRQVANALGAEFDNIVFTSGGTEANNMVLYQLLFSPGTPRRLITIQVEHSSILKMAAHLERCGYEVVYLPVDLAGQVSLTDLAAALK
jgi:cysteine desulfurase